MEEREADARPQIALLCGLIALIVLGELVLGPPSARIWAPLDFFLAVASFGAAGMLANARVLTSSGAGEWLRPAAPLLLAAVGPGIFAFLGGAVLASVLFPLPNAIWIATHALLLVAGIAAGALLLRRW